MSASTLYSALVEAGLTVRTYSDWDDRGYSWAKGKPVGVMIHHTAPPVPFPPESLVGDKLKANVNTKPDGTVWLLAYDACNYSSGEGSSVVLDEVLSGEVPSANANERQLDDDTNGNPYFWNFENDHLGDGSPIPEVQLDAIAVATAVVLDYWGLPTTAVISHAEWTARKSDPYWNHDRRCIEELRDRIGGVDDMTPEERQWLYEIHQVISIARNEDGAYVLKNSNSNLSYWIRNLLAEKADLERLAAEIKELIAVSGGTGGISPAGVDEKIADHTADTDAHHA
jgi:hypothetical protein